ncbi:uncharacterized protein MONOS_651 [Monocercomonoides exilis]|uniref:uncharacterized protein n=1 Tax=Monocercomonoides exilis TaxID=2049356 RepID=UPI00355A3FBD|nr:hypothetical protein MONOS_651 [Monocercomonoides exilis]|eukprot:MONOS_651.1-p1 / transcript=MONOS_651.1 / gene=MONOS_651 / organism=Monocercomonoides_exilis_PA203 / gene_product=unspecified product / transcript_product=unspecified product / location=Mono_scaffold00011:17404-19814(+) / protein_length=609 / sequence_SO=supercontig / SO=protein_coding / is_pseudo=false
MLMTTVLNYIVRRTKPTFQSTKKIDLCLSFYSFLFANIFIACGGLFLAVTFSSLRFEAAKDVAYEILSTPPINLKQTSSNLIVFNAKKQRQNDNEIKKCYKQIDEPKTPIFPFFDKIVAFLQEKIQSSPNPTPFNSDEKCGKDNLRNANIPAPYNFIKGATKDSSEMQEKMKTNFILSEDENQIIRSSLYENDALRIDAEPIDDIFSSIPLSQSLTDDQHPFAKERAMFIASLAANSNNVNLKNELIESDEEKLNCHYKKNPSTNLLTDDGTIDYFRQKEDDHIHAFSGCLLCLISLDTAFMLLSCSVQLFVRAIGPCVCKRLGKTSPHEQTAVITDAEGTDELGSPEAIEGSESQFNNEENSQIAENIESIHTDNNSQGIFGADSNSENEGVTLGNEETNSLQLHFFPSSETPPANSSNSPHLENGEEETEQQFENLPLLSFTSPSSSPSHSEVLPNFTDSLFCVISLCFAFPRLWMPFFVWPPFIKFFSAQTDSNSLSIVYGACKVLQSCVLLWQLVSALYPLWTNQAVAGRFLSKAEQKKRAEDRCSICYDSFTQPVELNCHHVYCNDCIASWIHHHPSCPLCRKPIKMNDKHKCEEFSMPFLGLV